LVLIVSRHAASKLSGNAYKPRPHEPAIFAARRGTMQSVHIRQNVEFPAASYKIAYTARASHLSPCPWEVSIAVSVSLCVGESTCRSLVHVVAGDSLAPRCFEQSPLLHHPIHPTSHELFPRGPTPCLNCLCFDKVYSYTACAACVSTTGRGFITMPFVWLLH